MLLRRAATRATASGGGSFEKEIVLNDFASEDAELEAALTMEGPADLAARAVEAARTGRWYAAAALSVAAWRKTNGRRCPPAAILSHVGMAFGRPAVLPPPEG